jgi:hypothetical protein
MWYCKKEWGYGFILFASVHKLLHVVISHWVSSVVGCSSTVGDQEEAGRSLDLTCLWSVYLQSFVKDRCQCKC